ncbi:MULTISPECIES: hypothetical protein [Leptospira]|uniref:hypothetical protein n=1 Tax=Leptospira TaxID=171 RepID=UPI00030FBE1D|nr:MULTISPECIES: hypothetical protein [Leptospira]KAA1293867.1 hypothetical protein C4X99_01550 [Leptospira interrogans serovar Geyaweera]QCO33083.1 hypothetical protein E4414_08355 [Leptospira interrogans]UML79956.1 hypothetical protein FH602_16995 [Leptospira kirschneri]UMQ56178.1 hypothetical protein FH582_12215 [Leptospira interrogans]
MDCNCGYHNTVSQSVNGELGMWPFDWIEQKATEFCIKKAYDHLTPIVALIICVFVILFLGGRVKWV